MGRVCRGRQPVQADGPIQLAAEEERVEAVHSGERLNPLDGARRGLADLVEELSLLALDETTPDTLTTISMQINTRDTHTDTHAERYTHRYTRREIHTQIHTQRDTHAEIHTERYTRRDTHTYIHIGISRQR